MAAYSRSFLLIIVLLTGWAASVHAQASGFSFNGVSNRIITPNGDHRNDNVAFFCSDPFDSAGSVKIYDLRGHLVTTIPINSGVGVCGGVGSYPTWDGTGGGKVVSNGVYIYVIAVESVVASGALVVIK
jgi:hypothetical protein